MDRPAIEGDFLDQTRRDRLQRDVGHQEDGFDPAVDLLVHARHLIFIFEVGDGAQAPDDDAGPLRFGKVHQQRVEAGDDDFGVDVRTFAANHVQPFLIGKHGRLADVGGDADHQLVDQLRATPNDVHMAKGDGIEGAGIDTDTRLAHDLAVPLHNIVGNGAQQVRLRAMAVQVHLGLFNE